MKKNLARVLVSVVLIALLYLGGIGFYAEKFAINTTFANVDISNLTIEQAHKEIIDHYNETEFILKEAGEEIATLKVADLNPNYSTPKTLEASYLSQDPTYWMNGVFNHQRYEAEVSQFVSLDTSKIEEALIGQGYSPDGRKEAVETSIEYNEEEGYHVNEGSPGDLVDFERVEDAILEGLSTSDYEIDLEETYIQPELRESDEAVQEILDNIHSVIATNITYDIAGEEVTIPEDEIEKWIRFDATNQLVIDGEAVEVYLNELNEEYATFNKERQFASTLQGIVNVPPGILGWGIDIPTEVNNVIADLHAGKDITRQPAMFSTGGEPGAEDEIGDTYVEIDLTYQTLYLYVDGQVILETPIVSGQPKAMTVPGANAVNEMLKDTKLVGYNQFSRVEYETPVQYWIRFDNNAQGMHDASWQGSYGGEVYTWAGSLGCINTPLWAMEVLYNHVQYGTPVMVFW